MSNTVTLDRVLDQIVEESYTILPSGKMVVCELILRNGFAVIGESGKVDKSDFDPEIGKVISRQRAINKIWELEGYALQERLFNAR